MTPTEIHDLLARHELADGAVLAMALGQEPTDAQARGYLETAARVVVRQLWDLTDELLDRVEKCSDPNNVEAGLVEGLFVVLVAETALCRPEGVATAIDRMRTAQV